MKDIATKSNTIDYAIVFTEENLIKYKRLFNDNKRVNIMIE